VLLDMGMPALSGLDVAREIRADPALRGTRLVLLSSMIERARANVVRVVGFDGFLVKPLRESRLLDCLRAVVAARGQAQPEVSRATLVTEESLQETNFGTRTRVLLVEDNPVNQRVASRMLQKLGYRVDLAEDGRQALEACERSEYDVVLMDCQMPVLDAFRATEELRRREEGTGRHLTIVAMTAHAMPGGRERCLEAGMDDHVSKPIKVEGLRRVLLRWRRAT